MPSGRLLASCRHCHHAIAILPSLADAEPLWQHLRRCQPDRPVRDTPVVETIMRHFRLRLEEPDDEPPAA